MKREIKLIQQRSNTSINFFDASDDFKQLKQTYITSGKLDDHGFEMSNNDLVKTWTLIFNTSEDYISFVNEEVQNTYWSNLLSYNASNSISYSLEDNNIE